MIIFKFYVNYACFLSQDWFRKLKNFSNVHVTFLPTQVPTVKFHFFPGHNSSNVTELKREFQENTEKNQKVVKEKQRTSIESTRSSFSSSSCSSSLSSLECSKASQLEPNTGRHKIVPESHAWSSPTCQPNASLQASQHPLDLRDVVKYAHYREARGISVKTASRGSTGGQTLKYIDSPRPFQQLKTEDAKASGLKESFQVNHKLQASAYKSNEVKHGSSTSSLRDARRFSYDGRESRDTFKSATKLKELPRLSLDSRAGSFRGSTTEMQPNHALHNSTRESENSNNILSRQQEAGSDGKPCSVVAKLMGLENLPRLESTKGNETKNAEIIADTKNDPLSVSSRILDDNKQYLISGSPRNPQRESISVRHKNVESDKKATSSLKFPIEPAPWKQMDESRGCQTPTLKTGVSIPKTLNSPLSVYGEIEKRLAHLEFKKSGKDLRALKQILEAMQKTKDMLEGRNEASNPLSHSSSTSNLNSHSKSTILQNLPNRGSNSASTKGVNSPKGSKSPIVIMKPTKFIEKASHPASLMNVTKNVSRPTKGAVKDISLSTNNLGEQSSQAFKTSNKNNGARLIRLVKTSTDPEPNTRTSTKQGKGSASMNLRSQQKKLGLEKQFCPKIPASDLTRTRRKPSRQLIETPDEKSNIKTIDEGYRAICKSVRDPSFQGDSVSMQSGSTISLASLVDDEVSSTDRSEKISDALNEQARRKQKNRVARSHKKPAITSSEQPSPVSVLDAALCLDDELPSPIKKISIAFKAEDEAVNSAELQGSPVDVNDSSSSAKFMLNPLIDSMETEDASSIIHHLKQPLSIFEENIADKVTAFYTSSNPNHIYILEIVLASGLLRDFESQFTTISLNPTGYPINHNLFLALEEANGRARHLNESIDKQSDSGPQVNIQRKLVFDFVNEMLPQKLQLKSSPKWWLSSNIPFGQGQRGHQLLGELCLEIDRLQSTNCSLDDEEDSLVNIIWADLKHQSTHWTAFPDETPGLVLDVERLIFKDLINEVVAVDLRRRSTGHCRQLFSK